MNENKKNVLKEHRKTIGVMIIILALTIAITNIDFDHIISSIKFKKQEVKQEEFLELEEAKKGSLIVDGDIYKPYSELLGSTDSESKYETNERSVNDEIVQMGQEVLNVSDNKLTILTGNSEGSKGPFSNLSLDEDSEILVTDYSGKKKSYIVNKVLEIVDQEDMDLYDDTLEKYKDSEAIVVVLISSPHKAFFAQPVNENVAEVEVSEDSE